MILETAVLQIKPGLASEFESVFRTASAVLLTKKGYIDHELHKCVENRDEYILLIRWTGIKDHLIGFRGHPDYKTWVQALEPYYADPPQIKHYIDIRVDSREQAEQELAELAETGDGRTAYGP
ncbi:antibiotic biosynthesis monooxygenase family protein [Paenibacillus ihbetae]|uniref:Antibiotic biosynthesis monooxygenase n=1 Tax=Paenibacillus ihbetae TaxID=1870820 RepID=A0A1B2E6T0_9BACL|nr:antibiotic biosynthesis monooxygenase family protein [Paenibacillus ihbetae]ANY75659.1 antibiotic biosynthesis monooxygenase [Paenibacillus ihbetae]OOC62168.1 antibiotic biosynthesis monooxygenase [Paenibacillus ihbetae]